MEPAGEEEARALAIGCEHLVRLRGRFEPALKAAAKLADHQLQVQVQLINAFSQCVPAACDAARAVGALGSTATKDIPVDVFSTLAKATAMLEQIVVVRSGVLRFGIVFWLHIYFYLL